MSKEAHILDTRYTLRQTNSALSQPYLDVTIHRTFADSEEARDIGRSFIFVGGAPRSGTTLVQRILNAHSLVYGGPEFDLIPRLMELRRLFLNKIEGGRIDAFLSKEQCDNQFSQFIAGIFRSKLKEAKSTYISEKTPSNVLVFSDICELFPEARCVLVLRDPRSIVASMLKVSKKAGHSSARIDESFGTTWSCLRYMNSCWGKGFEAARKHANVRIVFYEDIVANPETAVRQLCQDLELPFEEPMLHIEESAFEYAKDEDSWRHWYDREQFTAGIEQRPTESWQKHLRPYQVWLINRKAFRNQLLQQRYFADLKTPPRLVWHYALIIFAEEMCGAFRYIALKSRNLVRRLRSWM